MLHGVRGHKSCYYLITLTETLSQSVVPCRKLSSRSKIRVGESGVEESRDFFGEDDPEVMDLGSFTSTDSLSLSIRSFCSGFSTKFFCMAGLSPSRLTSIMRSDYCHDLREVVVIDVDLNLRRFRHDILPDFKVNPFQLFLF